MGTRGFVGFVADGNEKIAYNHWDSYPDGLGVDVLGWLRDALVTHPAVLVEQIKALRVVNADVAPTTEDVARLRRYTDTSVGSQSTDDWYVLLRGTRGNPGAMLDAGVIEDASAFPAQSLYAEWGYVVDVDARRFEVYKGFQTERHGKGRFASRQGENGYQPVALAASWPLDDLPTDDAFTAALRGDNGEESA